MAAGGVRVLLLDQDQTGATPIVVVTLNNYGGSHSPSTGDASFKCLPYQLSMSMKKTRSNTTMIEQTHNQVPQEPTNDSTIAASLRTLTLCLDQLLNRESEETITYDGDEPAAHFFSQLESQPNFHNLEPARQARKALSSLRGEPRKISQDLALLNKTYEEVKESLCAVYPRRPSFTLQEFYELKCTSMAEIETYYKNKVRIGLAINLPKSAIVQALSNGVLRNYGNLLKMAQPSGPEEWLCLAQQLTYEGDNTSTKAAQQRSPRQSRTPSTTVDKTPPYPCRYCGGQHWHAQCQQRGPYQRTFRTFTPAVHSVEQPQRSTGPAGVYETAATTSSGETKTTPYAPRLFFKFCLEENLQLNLKKCNFYQNEIDFLGYHITAGTYTPNIKNTEIINAIRTPINVKTLQSFLGAVNVYHKFIPEYARLRHPLNQLLKKNAKWLWSPNCQQAFDKLKQHLATQPVLHLFQEGLPCQVYCDASTQGIAGVLKQVHPDGNIYPVQYYSRALRSYERNYTISELECLAIVECVDKFRVYLLGTRFVIYSDHHALQWLKTIKDPTGRLFRWSLRLSAYDYEVKYLKGSRQYEADLHTLSRNPFCGFLSTGSFPLQLSEHVQNYPKIDDARELAYQRTHERHLRDKARFDQTHRASDFEVGDLVLAKTYHHPDTGKLAPFFSGPYGILEIISPQIVQINRSNRPLSRETDIIHVNKLKHYTENEQFISPPVNDRDQPKNTFNFAYKHFNHTLIHTKTAINSRKQHDYTYNQDDQRYLNHLSPEIFTNY
ncbi:hypothetical protein LAZ67_4004029 [Cordylochernes scorpioides]|uniref:Reverse transcriptase RNase H-like domain-containing protein n=1 Tax=Cordylochernes scorpioides TaxID=51811 RepID=A0ABY6KE65_9ARAC|nr:hypothetical protein LAZ67_4004029 [Cordylochernes scorpioides]